MNLSDALYIAVQRLHSRRVFFRPVHIPGFPTFPDRQSLVAFLAGQTTPERAGQQYRSAARRIQRWERGEDVPSPGSTYQLDAYLHRLGNRRVSVNMSACIRVSSETRCRWREHMRGTISEADLSSPGEFVPGFFEAYGIGGGVRVDDVAELTAQYA